MPDGNQAASGGTKDTCTLVTLDRTVYTISTVMKQDVKGTLICQSMAKLHLHRGCLKESTLHKLLSVTYSLKIN